MSEAYRDYTLPHCPLNGYYKNYMNKIAETQESPFRMARA
jgi:hypothetical protein